MRYFKFKCLRLGQIHAIYYILRVCDKLTLLLSLPNRGNLYSATTAWSHHLMWCPAQVASFWKGDKCMFKGTLHACVIGQNGRFNLRMHNRVLLNGLARVLWIGSFVDSGLSQCARRIVGLVECCPTMRAPSFWQRPTTSQVYFIYSLTMLTRSFIRHYSFHQRSDSYKLATNLVVLLLERF
jgi:hypothetical protein